MMVWPPITSWGPRSSVPPATSSTVVVPPFNLSVTSECVSSSSSTMSLTFGCCAKANDGDNPRIEMRASVCFILPPVANLTPAGPEGPALHLYCSRTLCVRRAATGRQAPELLLVEQRNSAAFLAQPFDLHQLQSAVLARSLQRIGPSP